MSSSSISGNQQDKEKEKVTVTVTKTETRELPTKIASTISTKSILSDFSRPFSDQNSNKAVNKQKKASLLRHTQ